MKKSALLLFSGGSDSTWLAYQLAQRYEKVYLLSLERRGFYRTREYTTEKAETLKKYFGSRRIFHQVVSVQDYHSRICFENYWSYLKKYKTLMASLSFSKLAFHWKAAEVALAENIEDVFDGGTGYMNMYPDQNRSIGFKNYQRFYKSLGLSYEQPLYDNNLEVEKNLYLVGLTQQERVRGTVEDRQVFYIEQVLLAHFLNYYLRVHGWDRYEEGMGKLYEEKVQFIQKQLSR